MFSTALSVLLQFAMMSLAMGAPIEVASHGNSWQYGAGGGVIGFIVLVLDIIVFIEVLKSNRTVPEKLLWCVVVFLFPIFGLVIYYLFSNRASHNTGGGYEAIP